MSPWVASLLDEKLMFTTLGTAVNLPSMPNARMLKAKSSETGQMA